MMPPVTRLVEKPIGAGSLGQPMGPQVQDLNNLPHRTAADQLARVPGGFVMHALGVVHEIASLVVGYRSSHRLELIQRGERRLVGEIMFARFDGPYANGRTLIGDGGRRDQIEAGILQQLLERRDNGRLWELLTVGGHPIRIRIVDLGQRGAGRHESRWFAHRYGRDPDMPQRNKLAGTNHRFVLGGGGVAGSVADTHCELPITASPSPPSAINDARHDGHDTGGHRAIVQRGPTTQGTVDAEIRLPVVENQPANVGDGQQQPAKSRCRPK